MYVFQKMCLTAVFFSSQSLALYCFITDIQRSIIFLENMGSIFLGIILLYNFSLYSPLNDQLNLITSFVYSAVFDCSSPWVSGFENVSFFENNTLVGNFRMIFLPNVSCYISSRTWYTSSVAISINRKYIFGMYHTLEKP